MFISINGKKCSLAENARLSVCLSDMISEERGRRAASLHFASSLCCCDVVSERACCSIRLGGLHADHAARGGGGAAEEEYSIGRR